MLEDIDGKLNSWTAGGEYLRLLTWQHNLPFLPSSIFTDSLSFLAIHKQIELPRFSQTDWATPLPQVHENRSDMPEHTGTDPADLPSKWQAPLKTSLTSIGMAVRTPAAAQKPGIWRQKLTRNRIRESRNLRSSRPVSSVCLFRTPVTDDFSRGSPHKSSTDPYDPNLVVSVRLRDENNKNLGTVHIHQDGTTNKK